MLFAQQNTVKTANLNSRINFYFVTSFYCFDNICISRHQGMKDMIFDKKTFLMTDLGLIYNYLIIRLVLRRPETSATILPQAA